MRRFLIRRSIYMLFTLIAATAVVFGLSRVVGDPLLLYTGEGGYGVTEEHRQAIAESLGLDKPLALQYVIWVGNLLRGNWGFSLLDKAPVWGVIAERIGPTFQLGAASWLLATLIGVPLGVLSAVQRATVWDYCARAFALFGQATPAFWFGILAILFFAVQLNWLPAGTRGEGLSLRHFVLPTITLGLGPTAGYLRITRSAMLEILDSEFVKLARAKGATRSVVLWKHAFRNALIPPLTVSALVMAGFITGSVITETVFAWPGLGRLAVESVWNNDFPLLTGVVLVFAIIFVLTNFLADVAYAYIDPRIRYE